MDLGIDGLWESSWPNVSGIKKNMDPHLISPIMQSEFPRGVIMRRFHYIFFLCPVISRNVPKKEPKGLILEILVIVETLKSWIFLKFNFSGVPVTE
jgi:hypothetical protein